MESLPDPVVFYAVAAALGGFAASGQLLARFPTGVTMRELLFRLKSTIYIAMFSAVGVAVLGVLRFLATPSTRAAAVEQVVFASLGTGLLARAASAEVEDERKRGLAAPIYVFNGLLDAVERDIRTDIQTGYADGVHLARQLGYRRLYVVALPHLFECVGEDATRRERFNANLHDVDTLALDSEPAARDRLCYLTLRLGGTPLLFTVMRSYYELYADTPQPDDVAQFLRARRTHLSRRSRKRRRN